MTAFGGLNLRQEDISSFLAACKTAGVDPTVMPILYTLHDDTLETFNESIQAAQAAGLNVAVYRCMAFDSRIAPTRLPQAAVVAGWNEADDSSAYPNLPGWVDTWWQWVRSQRPDLKIMYGAPNVDGFLLENTALEASLDIVGRHIGSTFSPPAAIVQGKPVWVTEIDMDPSRFTWGDPASMAQGYAELLACMERCLAAGVPAFAWGVLPGMPDASYDPTTLAAIAALNAKYATTQSQGGTNTMATPSTPDLETRVATLEQRDADITKALNLILKGEYTGATGAAGQVVALQGGVDDLTGNVKVPTFP